MLAAFSSMPYTLTNAHTLPPTRHTRDVLSGWPGLGVGE